MGHVLMVGARILLPEVIDEGRRLIQAIYAARFEFDAVYWIFKSGPRVEIDDRLSDPRARWYVVGLFPAHCCLRRDGSPLEDQVGRHRADGVR